jgi:hypothetical protein
MISGSIKYKKDLRELEGASGTARYNEQPKALFFYDIISCNRWFRHSPTVLDYIEAKSKAEEEGTGKIPCNVLTPTTWDCIFNADNSREKSDVMVVCIHPSDYRVQGSIALSSFSFFTQY